MTTKPKAKKYRIRRSESATPAERPAASAPPAATAKAAEPDGVKAAISGILQPEQMMFGTPADDGFGEQSFVQEGDGAPNAAQPEAAAASKPQSPAEVIDGIRREGLTGRQLRMARRVAQKQGLAPVSDYDAVRLLREKGIDPFKRSNMLELVVPEKGGADMVDSGAPVKTQLPSTVAVQPSLPSTEVVTEDNRATEIMAIQRDIAKRRRRRATLLAIRMMVFVLLPTFVAGYYYYAVATPMYATKSEFVIQTSEASSAGSLGGLFSGTGLATSQDSITVQGYLQSREAMIRLDEDAGFKAHFSDPDVDALQRIEADSSNEAAYSLFQNYVKIGYDPTEGVIKLEVSAASPATSERFSRQLIGYAEERVDQLTSRLRGDQMSGAQQSRKDAETKMRAAQNRIVELQERLGVLSPESEVQAIFGQITQLESQLLTERISLQQFLANPRPNKAKVNAAKNKITELQKLIAEYRALLTKSNANTGSLARISGELLVARGDLAMRQEFLAAAEAQFETARLEATRQVRYLSVGVSPVAPDEPTYPRSFENTLLAFLIFAGIYLMVSLTASILREQV